MDLFPHSLLSRPRPDERPDARSLRRGRYPRPSPEISRRRWASNAVANLTSIAIGLPWCRSPRRSRRSVLRGKQDEEGASIRMRGALVPWSKQAGAVGFRIAANTCRASRSSSLRATRECRDGAIVEATARCRSSITRRWREVDRTFNIPPDPR